MNAKTMIGKSEDYKVSKALMVYGKTSCDGYPYRHPFVTIHDVSLVQGEAELGPGRLVTPQILADLVLGLGFTIPTEILPENVIVRSSDTIVWWTPAKTRTMFFNEKQGDKMMVDLNGKVYPHPALLFKASGRSLWIRALAKNERPTIESTVYCAPYWNCSGNGSVCMGSSRIPRTMRVEQIAEWEASFFASEFTHAGQNAKPCLFKGGMLSMWHSLRGKSEFPSAYLRPVNQSLKEFVEYINAKYEDDAAAEAA
jgi:PRTRC genetic system protein B